MRCPHGFPDDCRRCEDEIAENKRLGENLQARADAQRAVERSALTPDSVGAQFCSDWLKGQIKVLYHRIEVAAAEHKTACDAWHKTRSELADVKAANTRFAMAQHSQTAQLKAMKDEISALEKQLGRGPRLIQ
jgi:hypothetical protein